MVNPVPKFANDIWCKWNIRGVVLVSLFLQIILIFLAPFRKRTRKPILVLVLWLTYLLADATANFCVGLISNKYGDEDTNVDDVNDYLLAFWTPFLLIHLGGPDTITAFSLEDNELWLRHMFGLTLQVSLTGYVFLLTLPGNTLWLPTTLVFLAGIIKFAERTRSLQLASVDNFRHSLVSTPDAGPNYAKLMDEFKSREDAGLPAEIKTMPEIADLLDDEVQHNPVEDEDGPPPKLEVLHNPVEDEDGSPPKHEVPLNDREVVEKAYNYFDTFKGLVVDMIFSFRERNSSREYFLKLTPDDALRVIEVELNFFYEAFYTKASLFGSKISVVFRFMSHGLVVAALVIFVVYPKHGFHKFDLEVTYTLLYGAVALDVVSLSKLIFSDYSFSSFNSPDPKKDDLFSGLRTFRDYTFRGFLGFFECFLRLQGPIWKKDERKCPIWLQNKERKLLCRGLLWRRWSESISAFNLISFSLHIKEKHLLDNIIKYIGAEELVEQWKYEKKQPLLEELWNFIYEELERKSKDADDVETIQRICSSRGEWVIQEGDIDRKDLDKLMPYVDRNSVTFDQCLVLWHIATDLLFYTDTIDDKENQDVEQGRRDNVDHEKNQDAEQGRRDNVEREKNQDVGQGKGGNVNSKKDQEDVVEIQRDIGKLLSDYMLYLLIMQPTMISAIRGIGQKRFQDTCAEASKFFNRWQSLRPTQRRLFTTPPKDMLVEFDESTNKIIMRKGVEKEQEACQKLFEVCVDIEPSAVKGDRSKSLLFDACKLAHVLNNLEKVIKWKIIAQVWVELLSYAAANCLPITHVQQLSKGGEFLSLVWLLMTHLGLAKQFQIKEGHARAKLIVGE